MSRWAITPSGRPRRATGLASERFPRWVYHWHSEGFRLPSGATSLARGEDFECQAFRYGPGAVGLQFHPEVTYAMICRWTVTGACRLDAPNATPPHRHREAWFDHDAAVGRWTRAFLADWARGAPEEQDSPAILSACAVS